MDTQIDTLHRLMKPDFTRVQQGICLKGKQADLVFSLGDILGAVTVIPDAAQIPEAVGLCLSHQDSVHKAYIAIPKESLERITADKKILKKLNIGLIAFSDESYHILREPDTQNPEPSTIQSVCSALDLKEKVTHTSLIYKALAHPLRLEIYLAVRENGTARLKDIARSCCGCYPLLMKHVSILEESGLIESERSAKETTLKLKSSPQNIDDIMRMK